MLLLGCSSEETVNNPVVTSDPDQITDAETEAEPNVDIVDETELYQSNLNLTSGNYDCVSLSTSEGDIAIGLDKINAPESVSNFLSYVNSGFYEGVIFHRVIDGFMVQGGGYDGNLNIKETNGPITNEANNGLSNIRGTIAMARTSEPHSANSQFFINTIDNLFLDYKEETSTGWGYAVFGQVVNGIDVVDKISGVETSSKFPFSQDVPAENIEIERATVIACSDLTQ